jgi:hypothetical protein
MGLALVTTWALMDTKVQYLPTPAEQLNPTRGIFAWNAEDQLAIWTALEALKTDPTHYEKLILDRALRIQEKMKTRDTVWVVPNGEEWLPPVQLTLPEMILTGHALSRYYCRPEEQDIDKDAAVAFCAAMNTKSQQLKDQISNWATVK